MHQKSPAHPWPWNAIQARYQFCPASILIQTLKSWISNVNVWQSQVLFGLVLLVAISLIRPSSSLSRSTQNWSTICEKSNAVTGYSRQHFNYGLWGDLFDWINSECSSCQHVPYAKQTLVASQNLKFHIFQKWYAPTLLLPYLLGTSWIML